MSNGPPPAYHPPGQFYSESQPPPGPQYNQFQGPISSQPPGWQPQAQPYAPQTYVQQPPPQQTIIITDPNYCHDCQHGRCRSHGQMTDEECCCLALAGACCLACLATNN